MPGILGASRGVYGPQTVAAVSAFQERQGQHSTGTVDSQTLHRLVEEVAPSPIAARGYLALALDRSWNGYPRLVALTAQFEAAGNFAARNRNTDRAGLSFGIIQWAQKPGRLNEILRAFQLAQPERFVEVFGGGDATVSSGLLSHTAKPNGGLDIIGQSTDPAFDLLNEIWGARFAAAGQDRVWQKTQIDEAVSAFRHSCTTIRVCAPLAQSERALAFLLDVANQHGNGGLSNICRTVLTAGLTEQQVLAAVAVESVRRVTTQFGEGSPEARSTQTRRDCFRTTALLSDAQFEEAI
jgi:peptidoglycan hydrolase-like protein with peptidoglycan-binding domain